MQFAEVRLRQIEREQSPLTRHGSASVLKASTFMIHLVPMTKTKVLTTSVAGQWHHLIHIIIITQL